MVRGPPSDAIGHARDSQYEIGFSWKWIAERPSSSHWVTFEIGKTVAPLISSANLSQLIESKNLLTKVASRHMLPPF